MKRNVRFIFILITALILLLAACSLDKTDDQNGPEKTSEAVTTDSGNASDAELDQLKEYVAANAVGLYWGHHQNMRCHLYKYVNEEKQSPMRFYQDDKTYIWFFDDNGDITCGGHDYFVYYKPDGDGANYSADLTDRDELYEIWYRNIHARNFIVLNDKFILLETAEKEDGSFEALVELRDPEACRELAESEAPDLPEDFRFEDGICFRYRYRFDQKTKDLLGYFHYSVSPNGAVRTLAEAVFLYDEETYNPFADGEPFGEYQSMQENPETNRRVTVTFDPDTEYENKREFVIPETAEFDIYFRDSKLAENLYTDRECTVPYTADTSTEDVELFVRDKSENAASNGGE